MAQAGKGEVIDSDRYSNGSIPASDSIETKSSKVSQIIWSTCPIFTSIGNFDQVGDHNAGVGLLENLHDYLANQSPAARSFYEQLLAHPIVTSLIEDMEAAIVKSHERDGNEWRDAFDRLHEMRSTDFIVTQAQRVTAALSQ